MQALQSLCFAIRFPQDLPSICNSLGRVEPSDTMFDLNLASDEITTSPLTVRSLLTVVSPLNITLKASDLFENLLPFPITKAVFAVLYEVALFVTEDPEELNCPITKRHNHLQLC